MEFVEVEYYSTCMMEVTMKKEFESNVEALIPIAHDTLASIENKSRYNEHTQVKKKLINKEEFDAYSADINKSYDENNLFNQVLMENCNAQTLERYRDFVINGHFLTDILPVETPEKINTYKECPKCNKKFMSKGFRKHSFYCGKDADLQCNYCSFKTKYKECLGNHLILVHADTHKSINNMGLSDLVCSKCEKKLSSKRSLKKHEHYCNNPEYFHCSNCSYNTKHKYNLIKHIESVHSSIYSVACPKCGKTLKNRNTLSVHFFYCGKEPNFQCSSCSYKTKYKRDLILHSAKIHSKDLVCKKFK